MYQLSATCNDERDQISYLQAQVQVLRGQINELNSRNQQQQEIQNKSYTWMECMFIHMWTLPGMLMHIVL